MKRLGMFALVLVLIGSGACAQKNKMNKDKGPELTTKQDSLSYILGASLGMNIRQAEIENTNMDLIMSGIKDGLESDSAMKVSMEAGNSFMRAYMQEKQKAKAAEAETKALEYIDNVAKTEEGYQKTDSGILYKVLQEGTGPKPGATDKVRVHYEGTNMEGEVFDSSYERGQPAEFPLNRVIAGWTEILQMMPVGSTWKVIIPPSLAYGERGSPPKIGPNEVLTFKIELLDIVTEPKR